MLRPITVTALALALSLAPLAGCDSPKPASRAPEAATEPDPADAVTADAIAHAERLAAAIDRSTGGADDPAHAVDQVVWLPANRSRPTPTPEPPPRGDDAGVRGADTLVIDAAPRPADSPPAAAPPIRPATPGTAAPKPTGDPLARALASAAASVSDPAAGIDAAAFDALTWEQQEAVRSYHQLVTSVAESIAADGGTLDRQAIADRLDELWGERPIRIRKVELCKRVSGYGVYEPFEDDTFLAGQPQKVIVYVELDNFRPMDLGDRYEVKLTQQLALYDDADGVTAWKEDPVEIKDRSRNRRRDFFVVQVATLPARLGVGRFRLKVSVTDMHGGSIDEQAIPIEFVADRALAEAAAPRE